MFVIIRKPANRTVPSCLYLWDPQLGHISHLGVGIATLYPPFAIFTDSTGIVTPSTITNKPCGVEILKALFQNLDKKKLLSTDQKKLVLK